MGASWTSPGSQSIAREQLLYSTGRSSLSSENQGQILRQATMAPVTAPAPVQPKVYYVRTRAYVPDSQRQRVEAESGTAAPAPVAAAPVTSSPVTQAPVAPTPIAAPAPTITAPALLSAEQIPQAPEPAAPILAASAEPAAPAAVEPITVPAVVVTPAPAPETVATQPEAPKPFVPYEPEPFKVILPTPEAAPAPAAVQNAPADSHVTFSAPMAPPTAAEVPAHDNMPSAPKKYEPFEPALSGYLLPPRSGVRIASRIPLGVPPEREAILFASNQEYPMTPLTQAPVVLGARPKALDPNGDNEKRKFTRPVILPIVPPEPPKEIKKDATEPSPVQAAPLPTPKTEEINTLTPFIEWIKRDPQAAEVARRSTQDAAADKSRNSGKDDLPIKIELPTPVTEAVAPGTSRAIYTSPTK